MQESGTQRLGCKKLHVRFSLTNGWNYALKPVHYETHRIDINFVIKVADFGLSESIGTKNYFRQDKDSTIKLPLKWLAPESMEDHVFSKKSDVVCIILLLYAQP